MSVIVLGMEMPIVCIQGDWYGNCPMDRTWCAQRFAPKGMTMGQISEEQQDKLPDWCPLRPLPEMHGRLVDVDAIIAELKDGDAESGVKTSGADLVVAILLAYLDSKPTIVEAEGD